MIRLALLGLLHETNTFAPALAEYDWAADLRLGTDLVDRYGGSRSTCGGYLTLGDQPDVEVVPLGVAEVTPSGPMTADAFDAICDRLLALLGAAAPVDGVLLALHGACVTEGRRSADADVAERVRAVAGSVPIGCVVDMHANLDRGLVDAVDVLLAYQTNPHVDAADRARLCGSLVLDIVRGRPRPAMSLVSLPLAVTIVRQDTSAEPMASLLRFARSAAERSGAVDVSLVEGFPYADVEHLGMSVLAVHDDAASARRVANEVAAEVWRRRADLQGTATPLADGLAAVASHRGRRPLLLLDVGDNIGGGAPGDSTAVLEQVLAKDVHDVVTTLVDPVAVDELLVVPPGSRVTVTVGARTPAHAGDPVTLTGVVTGHHRGSYSTATVAHGGFRVFDPGAMAGIRTDSGVAVVLTSAAVQPVAPEQLTAVGVRPDEFRAVIAKGVNGPRAGYAAVCAEPIELETPGVTRNDITTFGYRHRRRPLFPFEPDAHFGPIPATEAP